jgi:hypothetical protein
MLDLSMDFPLSVSLIFCYKNRSFGDHRPLRSLIQAGFSSCQPFLETFACPEHGVRKRAEVAAFIGLLW